jgi:hypothetical protein
MAEKKKQDAKKKNQKGKKGKGSASKSGGKEIRLSEHPRASVQIKLAKSWGGLAGFALAGWAAWHGGAPFYDAALRAVFWGIVAYVVVWACAVQVWRHLAVAEVRAAERRWREVQAAREQRAREQIEAEAARRAKMAAKG